MSRDGREPERLFTRRLLAYNLLLIIGGAVLIATGVVWLGVLMMVVAPLGSLPLLLEQRRRNT
jgi:hypothetical protein